MSDFTLGKAGENAYHMSAGKFILVLKALKETPDQNGFSPTEKGEVQTIIRALNGAKSLQGSTGVILSSGNNPTTARKVLIPQSD
jgi:hypothetical protein